MNSDIDLINSLRDELNRHNYNYYVLSAPTISDYDFDMKMKELQRLEALHPELDDPNSPTKRVGSDISNEFKQITHSYPMLSLANTYSNAEVTDFYMRIRKALGVDFLVDCELKYDGTSISLRYEDGRLVRAVTRGDGEKGDDVTENVRTISSIPLVLQGSGYPEVFEIRGEILMPWSVFNELNAERVENGLPPFANPRNAASGTLKLLNSKEVAKRKLDAYLYYFISDDEDYSSHYENLQKAKEWGFKISDASKRCSTLEEIFDYIQYWDDARRELPVATDGIVLKVDAVEQQNLLGFTSKTPRWAIAYKFQAERIATQLKSVSFQVGRMGTITPVANLEPVTLSGTVVKRASLHNADIIAGLDLHIGDSVYVEKGGEIIPKIVGVDEEARKSGVGERVHFISQCPECGTELKRMEGEAAHYCPNDTTCPPQIKGRIIHFASRKAMNINLGEENVNLFYELGMVKNVADLYSLNFQEIASLPRWGMQSAKRLAESLEQSKSVPFDRVLFALGIRYVGSTTAKKIASALQNIEAISSASYQTLMDIDEVGEVIANSVMEFFANEQNRNIVNRLKEAGLQFALGQAEEQASNKLEGLSIVISGTFERYSRDELKQLIEAHGGKNVSSISSKTDYVLAGANMGPAKLEKANALGVKIMSEADFIKMIE
ncbi:MAG: NAD-dependent DNA ligase LigA [Paludibacteraceae bacterium]|jgi:DNA ligase (NAD+)|nr:NAD-dependent DNA ligase LigA [Paludibacteraceae bacterium]